MANNVKVSLMGDLTKAFENELRQAHKAGMKKLMTLADNRVKDSLRNTLRNRFDSGSEAFTTTRPESTITVNTTVNGAVATYHIYMKDDLTQTPSFVWHLINGGRAGGKLTKNIAFRPRKNARTQPKNLMAGKFPGYSGKSVFMKAGDYIAPIKPRKWYMVAAQDLKRELKLAKYKEMETHNIQWSDF